MAACAARKVVIGIYQAVCVSGEEGNFLLKLIFTGEAVSDVSDRVALHSMIVWAQKTHM